MKEERSLIVSNAGGQSGGSADHPGRAVRIRTLLLGVSVLASTLAAGTVAHAQPITPACPRFPAGSVVPEPPDLFSSNGVLNVALTYETTVAANGNQLFCYMQTNGTQSPTLHVNPGDTAPDFTVKTLETKTPVQLGSLWTAQPVVLVFGSYT